MGVILSDQNCFWMNGCTAFCSCRSRLYTSVNFCINFFQDVALYHWVWGFRCLEDTAFLKCLQPLTCRHGITPTKTQVLGNLTAKTSNPQCEFVFITERHLYQTSSVHLSPSSIVSSSSSSNNNNNNKHLDAHLRASRAGRPTATPVAAPVAQPLSAVNVFH